VLDPNRIKIIMEALEKAWNKQPDLRLGQFLMNTVYGPCGANSLYCVDDDKLLELLKQQT